MDTTGPAFSTLYASLFSCCLKTGSDCRIPGPAIYMCRFSLKNEVYNNSCYSYSMKCKWVGRVFCNLAENRQCYKLLEGKVELFSQFRSRWKDGLANFLYSNFCGLAGGLGSSLHFYYWPFIKVMQANRVSLFSIQKVAKLSLCLIEGVFNCILWLCTLDWFHEGRGLPRNVKLVRKSKHRQHGLPMWFLWLRRIIKAFKL